MFFNGAPPSNETLQAVYKFMRGEITRYEMCHQANIERTNAYYIIGRALAYWVSIGVLNFSKIEKPEDLGGS